jgi:hypothetical protein
MRGRVQRIHMMTPTSVRVFEANHSMETSCMAHHGPGGKAPAPRQAAQSAAPAPGSCQPPRKSVTAMALITHRLPHSTRKKRAKRKPEYSVM